MPKITSAIDIGCGKICCMIAQNENNGDIKILGTGVKKSEGIHQGKVQDAKAAKDAILSTIHLAEHIAGINIGKNIIVNINGLTPNILTIERQFQLHGRTIRQEDIAALRNEARYHINDPQQQLLHYFEHGFFLEPSPPAPPAPPAPPRMVSNPLSQSCDNLTLRASLLFVSKDNLMQFMELLHQCQLHIGAIAYAPYASAQSILQLDEKNHGTLMLDIGAETTSVCVYNDNIPTLCDTIIFGGQNITNDIANQLNMTIDDAERLKSLHGNLIETSRDRHRTINFLTFDNKTQTINKSKLIKIIKTRTNQLAHHIEVCLQKTDIQPQSIKNIVMSGGAANMPGFCETLQAQFHRPVRIAKPLTEYPPSPTSTKKQKSRILGLAASTTGVEFACIIGMLRYANLQEFHLGSFTAEHDGNAWMQLWHWIMQDPI